MTFRIVVKEYRIENSFHTASITKDSHGFGSPLYFSKRSFYEIGSADFAPQGDLGLLNLLAILPLSLLSKGGLKLKKNTQSKVGVIS